MPRMPSILAVAASIVISIGLSAQGPPQRPPAGQRGPWQNDINVFHVQADGRVSPLATFPRAGVSSLARLGDGRLIAAHQHFPENNDADFDKVAVHFSNDDGRTWTEAAVIQVAGLPQGMRFPFDPTLVPLPDGRIRLYFTSRMQGRADLPAIYSASSTDGIRYTFEPGRRFGIDGRPVIDCAVALHNGVFHLFAPDNGPASPNTPGGVIPGTGNVGVGYHATSRDGLTFTREPDVRVAADPRTPEMRRGNWLGAVYSDGKTMTFFGTGGPGIWTATSADGATWQSSVALRVPGADPGAVPARDGGWIVSATGARVR